MALRDQPYLPLYIKDFITDEKLVHCSPAANGILIRLMCLLHKEESYGKLLLQQKYRQTGQQKGAQLVGFADQLEKSFPFKAIDIHAGLEELFNADVIQVRGFVLSQKRMVRDGEISDKRASSGGKGGKVTAEKNKKFATEFATANIKANTANAIEYANEAATDLTDRGVGKDAEQPPFPFSTDLPHWTLEACELSQHAQTGNKNTQFILDHWDIFILERTNDPERVNYHVISDLTKFFLNWMRSKFPKHGTSKQRTDDGKPPNGTSAAQVHSLTALRGEILGSGTGASYFTGHTGEPG